MGDMRRGARAGPRRGWPWFAPTALLLWASACGPLHTPVADGDGDEDFDAVSEADVDADVDPDEGERPDVDVEPDADERPDADRVDVEDVDPEVDGDPDFETSEATWLLASTEHGDSFVRLAKAFPGGGVVVSGRRSRQWLARLDSAGEVLWSRMIGPTFGRDITSLSVAPDGRIYVTALDRIAAFDGDGRVLWQRQAESFGPRIQGLPDGSVILYQYLDVMRYSPTEGVLWSWHLNVDVGYSEGESFAVTESGMIVLATGPIVVALDIDGSLLWAGRWSGSPWPDGPVPVGAVVPTEAGGVLLVGGRTISIVRLDPGGRIEWLRSMGTHVRPDTWDPCHPRCPVDAAVDAAVAATGEAMVVGASTNAAERLGWEIDATLYALWLDRDGVVTSTLAVADRVEEGGSFGYAAAALSGGGWTIGGALLSEAGWTDRALLASFDGPGRPGGECRYAAEASLTQTSETATLEPLAVRLSPSDLEVVEGEPLLFEDFDVPIMERLCW